MRHENKAKEAYTRRFLRFSDAIEKRLVQGIIVCLLVLLTVQALLLHDGIRSRLSMVDRLEGDRLHFAPPQHPMLY